MSCQHCCTSPDPQCWHCGTTDPAHREYPGRWAILRKWQGDIPFLDQHSEPGVYPVAILRATLGEHHADPRFRRHWLANRTIMVEHYLLPTQDGGAQAQFHYNTLADVTQSLGYQPFAWCTLERRGSPTFTCLSALRDFLDAMGGPERVGIHTSTRFASEVLQATTWMRPYPVWIEHYAPYPSMPRKWRQKPILWGFAPRRSRFSGIDIEAFCRRQT